MKYPDFFIVGAPKCGTTSMCNYLDQHPDIFISKPKELNFFGADLTPPQRKLTLEEYLKYFENSQNKICGEGTPFYLLSKAAGQEIKALNPNAKIIIMLRDPVALIYSLHSQLLFGSSENVADFKKALELEPYRKKGQHIPDRCNRPEALFYSDIVHFSDQVKNYWEIFGKENVHIIIFDDFKQNIPEIYKQTLDFLGVQSDFEANFQVHNPNTQVKAVSIYRFLRKPPAWIFKLGRAITPSFLAPLRRKIGWSFIKKSQKMLTAEKPRPKLDSEFEHDLRKRFSPEVEKLSQLIDRDLSHWMVS